MKSKDLIAIIKTDSRTQPANSMAEVDNHEYTARIVQTLDEIAGYVVL